MMKSVSQHSSVKLNRLALELVGGNCFSSLGAALGKALLHDTKLFWRPETDLNHYYGQINLIEPKQNLK